MEDFIKLLTKVIVTFLLTNIQDVVILMNYFLESSKENSSLKTHHVVIGQYLGFSTLLSLSLIGYLISYVLPVKVFGFLGFVIIFFGLNGLYQAIRSRIADRKTESRANELEETIELSEDKNVEDKQEPTTFFSDVKSILKISLVTIANGNDNISIYVPIFVQSTSWQIVVYAFGFLLMVAVLCLICYTFIHLPPVLKFARKYAQWISPFVFLVLGVFILIDSRCFPWLMKSIQTGNWLKEIE